MTDSTIAPRVAAKAEARLGNTAARWREAVSLREMGVYYALLLLVIVLSVTTTYLGRTNYLSVQNISNVLYQASLPALMSVSMTVVLVSGNFDLSVASVAALSAAVLMGTANSLGFPASLVLAMAASVAVGLINGAIVEFVGINAFIVTLGSLTAVRGLVLIYSDGKTMFVSEDRTIAAMKAFESGLIPVGYALAALGAVIAALGAVWTFADLRKGRGLRPASVGTAAAGLVLLGLAAAGHFEIKLAKPVLYMFAFAAFVWSVMSFTKYGRRLYAVGGNPEAARLSGINVRLYKLMAFALCSGTAGFAGVLFASRLRSINPNALQGEELTVIAAAILGGTSLFGGKGSVVRSVTGALLLFTLTNGFNIANLGANYQSFVEGIVVVGAAAIYSVGGGARVRGR